MPTRICDSCGGLWFDRQEIRDYLAQATAVQTDFHRLDLLRESHPEATGYQCLRCPDTALARIRAYGIELEQCPDCRGIFLDFGEIEDLTDQTRKNAEELRRILTTPVPGSSRTSGGSVVNGFDATVSILDLIFDLMD